MASGDAFAQSLTLVDAGAAGRVALEVTVASGAVSALASAAMQAWDGRRWTLTSEIGLTPADLLDLDRSLTRLVRTPVGAAGVVEWWETDPLAELALTFAREAASASISLDIDIASANSMLGFSASWSGIERSVAQVEHFHGQVRSLLAQLSRSAAT